MAPKQPGGGGRGGGLHRRGKSRNVVTKEHTELQVKEELRRMAPLQLLLLYGQLELQIFLLRNVILLDQHCWRGIYWILQPGWNNSQTSSQTD